jgi:hypothetical protein
VYIFVKGGNPLFHAPPRLPRRPDTIGTPRNGKMGIGDCHVSLPSKGSIPRNDKKKIKNRRLKIKDITGLAERLFV